MSVHHESPYSEEPYGTAVPPLEYGEAAPAAMEAEANPLPSYEEADPAALYDESASQANGAESVPPTEENGVEPLENRRALRRYRKGDVVVESGDEEEGEILVVSVRLRPAGKNRSTEGDEPEARSKMKRLMSKSPPLGGSAPAAGGPADANANANANAPAPPSGAPLMKLTPRTAQGAAGRDQWDLGTATQTTKVALTAGILAVIVLAYVLGHRSNPPSNSVRTNDGRVVAAPVAKLTASWSPAMISQLDAIMEADAAGDLKTARQLAFDFKKKQPDAPGLTQYFSTLQTRMGDYNDAEVDVSKLIDPFAPPAQAAAVNAHLGFIYARHRDFPRALGAFADAAAADPFNPDYFQQWAEASRRSGQLQEAIDHFKQALTRLPAGRAGVAVQREDIEFKLRLAQIEAGKDDESLKSAIDGQLRLAAPTGYWFLTAAAFALQHGDMTTAADALMKARRTLPNDVYAALTNDYFFHGYTVRKEMAGLLPEDTPQARMMPFMPRMGYFIDP